MDIFDEEIRRQCRSVQERWLKEHKFIKIPQPGDKVSFPVACVTGVCFIVTDSPWIRRWKNKNLEWWSSRENKWIRDGADVSIFSGNVTVVEEPKPEPVWKDCNFIEAVEWMKAKPNEHFAKWNGCEYWISNDHIWRKQTGALLNYNINAVLGKWQIKVEG